MSREFFNTRASTWDERVAEKDTSRLAAMAGCIDIKPGDTMLDVGTGTGVFVPFFLDKIGSKGRLVCLDYAEKMLEIARSKRFGGNISFICADIEDSGLPGDSFDAVVCYSVFPHFRDKSRALGEIYRVLKPNCPLFICHTSSRQAINEIHRGLPEICDHVFPENDVTQRMLAAAGFEDISISDGRDSYFISARKPGNS